MASAKSKAAAKSGSANQAEGRRPPPQALQSQRLEIADIGYSVAAGWRDFVRRPLLSGFFGLFYCLFGLAFLAGLLWLDRVWLILPLAVGFPLVAPFAAAGLYDISRRLERGEKFGWRDVFTVIWAQRNREMGWMAFVTLFVFWFWLYQARLLLAIFLQSQSFSTFDRFVEVVATTTNGWLFLGVGTVVGAFWASVLFTVTVISMPLLLDRQIDFVSAMVLSVKTVFQSPVVMLGWGLVIAALMLASMIPAFVGLIVVLPVLGHATWHLYRRAIKATK
ncbi:DUF2189 domain-containing protein [Salaquimonas pukyongi]|uniref:DUF2189 domain-containing protein n=1 Tax=Salaquimonas pukyongi TaxID=2712698 RepID=UPI0009F9A2DC|nr:DUF2189 domain-containing protein [Salaquimonas pukyongi]